MRKLISFVGLILSLWFIGFCASPILAVSELTIQSILISIILILAFAIPAYLDFTGQISETSESVRIMSVFVGAVMLATLSRTKLFEKIITVGQWDADIVIMVMSAMLIVEILVALIALIKILRNRSDNDTNNYDIEVEQSEPRQKIKPQQLNQNKEDVIEQSNVRSNKRRPKQFDDVKEVFKEAENQTKENSYNLNDLK